MKFTLSLVAAVAATVAATGFKDANPFSCPGNTNNQCSDQQAKGFDFGDVPDGPVSTIGGFGFNGFTCGSSPAKRFARRTSGKALGGVCHPEQEKSPSFYHPTNQFSVVNIFVEPEFACDLELHYGMPDGSTCKTRHSCGKSGTLIPNQQCGGAKNVSIVYPSQPSMPKPSCTISVHSIGFTCGTTSTKSIKTLPPTTYTTTTAVTTSSSSIKTVPPATTSSTSTTLTTVMTVPTTSPSTISSTSSTTSSTSALTTSSTLPLTTSSTSPLTTSSTSSTSTSVITTSFLSTSTIFTTITSTITSCATSITNCPSHSTITTVITVPLTTTVCPVTQTLTTSTVVIGTTTVVTSSSSAISTSISTSTSTISIGTTSTVSSSTAAVQTTTSTAPPPPATTLPCPGVVPACLNTFLFSISCIDNTDHGCYCGETIFIQNVFDCIYAHGETDIIISQAVIFIQGLCANHIPTNPAIATGATITSYITVSQTSALTAVPYTVVTVQATTVVPCTNSAGSVLPSSSSTSVFSTAISLPQIGFTTAGSTVAIVPISTYQVAPTTPAAVTPATTALTTVAPIGTGSLNATTTKPGIVTVNAAGRPLGAGSLSVALAVLAFLAL